MTDDKDAEELTQGYFQKFGGFTCSWENVQQIISEMLETEKALKETLSRAGYRIAELKHEIDELKAHCKAVDEVNAKMKCCGNCKKIFICQKADISGMGSFPYNCKDWELAE